jgi:hypothetical protein
MASYTVILLTMICGALQLGWWTAAIGGACAGLLCLADQRHLKPRFAANDNLALLNPIALLAATLHATLGACAYPLGNLIRLMAP